MVIMLVSPGPPRQETDNHPKSYSSINLTKAENWLDKNIPRGSKAPQAETPLGQTLRDLRAENTGPGAMITSLENAVAEERARVQQLMADKGDMRKQYLDLETYAAGEDSSLRQLEREIEELESSNRRAEASLVVSHAHRKLLEERLKQKILLLGCYQVIEIRDRMLSEGQNAA